MNLQQLELVLVEAIYKSAKYIAVEIKTNDTTDNEIIINRNNAILEKLLYYKKSYNNDLTLKSNNDIKIVNAVYTNTLSEIEDKLCSK